MKILLLGSGGQVGAVLVESLLPLGELIAYSRPQLDVTHPEALGDVIATHAPDILVNATAYTAVDQAEKDPNRAYAVNADAVASMAAQMRAQGGLLVHYSTDYVYDGAGDAPYRESSIPAPLNVYGASKLAGEEAIRASGVRHLIFRTSWVYGGGGNHFARAILQRAQQESRVAVVDDQIGAPTHAARIASATAKLLAGGNPSSLPCGTFHMAAAGEISRYGFAQFLLEQAAARGFALRCVAAQLIPVATQDFPTLAKRPRNSRLAMEKFSQAFGFLLPDWREDAALWIDTMMMERDA